MFKKISFLFIISMILCFAICFTGCSNEDVNSSLDNSSQIANSPSSTTSSTENDSESNTTETNSSKVDKEDISSISSSSNESSSQDKQTSDGNSSTSSKDKKPSKNNSSTSSKTSSTSSTQSQASQNTPTYLNPKKYLKIDTAYEAKFFGNDGKSYHIINITFYGLDSFDYSKNNFYNKEFAAKRLQDWGMDFIEEDYEFIEVKGIKYYDIGDYEGCAHPCKITSKNINLTRDLDVETVLLLQKDGTLIVDDAITNIFGTAGTKYKPEK